MNIKQVLRPNLQQQATAAERKPQQKQPSPVARSSTDRAAWSKQALAFVEEQNRIMWEQKPDKENGSSLYDSLKRDMKTQDKCLKIAVRIQKGDKVPPEDLAYLAKTDPQAYMMAIALRHEKPDPKKWESVLDEEDRNGGMETAEGAEAVADSSGAAEGPSGGAASGGGGTSGGSSSGEA